jgi:hypothetical protein
MSMNALAAKTPPTRGHYLKRHAAFARNAAKLL